MPAELKNPDIRCTRAARFGWVLVALLMGAGCARRAAPAIGRSVEASDEATPARPNLLGPVYANALAGDVREALRILDQLPVAEMDSSQRSQRECLLRTFVEKEALPLEVGDRFVADLIGIYRDYWMRVLLQEMSVPDGEAYLLERLGAFLSNAGYRAHAESLDALVDELGPILLQRGFHSIRGVTRPYYELMVWATETAQSYEVELPETTITVEVVFMKDFAVLGWSAFATCGKAYSGGWAKEDSLYCVADAYDTTSETFSVSYLAHESQHFADYRAFPKLEQPELEYRAKLVELSKADKTARSLVIRFASQIGQSRSAPHNLANLKVAEDLSRAVFDSDSLVADEERWERVAVSEINRVARELLKRNTEKLTSLGAATVTQVLK